MDLEPGDGPPRDFEGPCGLAETPTLSAAASVNLKGFLRLDEGQDVRREMGVTR